MQLINLKIGKELEIYIIRDGYRYRLTSWIEATAPGRVYIRLIAAGTKIFHFLDTDLVEIIYKDDQQLLQWSGVKGSIERYAGRMMHCLSSDAEGVLIDRRQAIRVNFSNEIVLYRFNYKVNGILPGTSGRVDEYGNEFGTYEIDEYEAMLKDISENGVGFYTKKRLEVGNIVGFPMYTPYGMMYFKAEIVRRMDKRNGKYTEFYGGRLLRANRNLSSFLYSLQSGQYR